MRRPSGLLQTHPLRVPVSWCVTSSQPSGRHHVCRTSLVTLSDPGGRTPLGTTDLTGQRHPARRVSPASPAPQQQGKKGGDPTEPNTDLPCELSQSKTQPQCILYPQSYRHLTAGLSSGQRPLPQGSQPPQTQTPVPTTPASCGHHGCQPACPQALSAEPMGYWWVSWEWPVLQGPGRGQAPALQALGLA